MTFDPERHRRRSIRLKGYDYSRAGVYFITVVTQDRQCLFGDVIEDRLLLNDPGRRVAETWTALAQRFPGLEVDAFVVMPNHFHGLLVLAGDGVGGSDSRACQVGDVVGAFKSITTVEYNRGVNSKGWPSFGSRLWQRNFYEHVVRDEGSLRRVRRYIAENPARWGLDRENPARTPER